MANSDDRYEMLRDRELSKLSWVVTRQFSFRGAAERRAEREEAGEDDSEEDETPVVIPPSAVTIYPKEPQCQHRPLRYKCSKREWT